MSSPEKPISLRGRLAGRGLVLAACLAASLGLAGCLQPLYGPMSAGGADIASKLQGIKIVPISDRIGHYLENELRFGFNGTGAQAPTRYVLYIGLRENVQSPLVDTVTGYPTSGTVVVSADYTLTGAEGGQTIVKGTATVASSYDRTSQRYANLRASRDAEIRNARLLADQIRTNIAAAFADKG